jgi:hypothetical protein
MSWCNTIFNNSGSAEDPDCAAWRGRLALLLTIIYPLYWWLIDYVGAKLPEPRSPTGLLFIPRVSVIMECHGDVDAG